jgi:hypothetical protein
MVLTLEDFCAALYTARVPGDTFGRVMEGQLAFVASADSGGEEERFLVECRGVTALTVSGEPLSIESTVPLELSVIELSGSAGAWHLYFDLWGTRDIEFDCEELLLNGGRVIGSGRHLQDWLPERKPKVPPFRSGAA